MLKKQQKNNILQLLQIWLLFWNHQSLPALKNKTSLTLEWPLWGKSDLNEDTQQVGGNAVSFLFYTIYQIFVQRITQQNQWNILNHFSKPIFFKAFYKCWRTCPYNICYNIWLHSSVTNIYASKYKEKKHVCHFYFENWQRSGTGSNFIPRC